jgi:protein SCO1
MRTSSGLSRRWLIALSGTAVVLVAAAAWAWHTMQPVVAPASRYLEVAHGAYMLAKSEAVADFELVKHDDAPFGNQALMGRWSFVIFGYTFCPDFCPTTLVVFNEMHRLLSQQPGGGRDVQFVMVSVDPERDTTKTLKAYVPQFNPEFIGVTGNTAVITRLTDSLGAVYEKHPGSTAGTYLIDHSSTVYLINPQGRLQAVFAPQHVAADMVNGFQKIREQGAATAGTQPLPDPSTLKLSAR